VKEEVTGFVVCIFLAFVLSCHDWANEVFDFVDVLVDVVGGSVTY